MMFIRFIFISLVSVSIISCSEGDSAAEKKSLKNNSENINSTVETSEKAQAQNNIQNVESADTEKKIDAPIKRKPDYVKLRNAITIGSATLAEVKQALTEEDVVNLSNTIHALYSMRWHRGVYHLYYDIWHLKKDKHPDFAWESLEKVPARIALASTINRVQINDTEEFQDYIRSHMHDEHEFHRAQVVVALGLNGDPDDVEYIKSMADDDNHYVTQSAISSLALVGHDKARDAMIDLYKKYHGTPRGDLLVGLLKKAYKVEPEERQTEPKAE